MSEVEVPTASEQPLGDQPAVTAKRTPPKRLRSLVGGRCFTGPSDVTDVGGADAAPDSHSAVQPVSRQVAGDVEHSDSGGVHVVVQPGEVDLTQAGALAGAASPVAPHSPPLRGQPFEEDSMKGWSFVDRSHDEMFAFSGQRQAEPRALPRPGAADPSAVA